MMNGKVGTVEIDSEQWNWAGEDGECFIGFGGGPSVRLVFWAGTLYFGGGFLRTGGSQAPFPIARRMFEHRIHLPINRQRSLKH